MVTCVPGATYILVGDWSSDMVLMAEWLVAHGATHLILNAKYGVLEARYRVWCLRLAQQGVNVSVSKADVTRLRDTVQLVKNAQLQGPVAGIVYTHFCHLFSILSQVGKCNWC